MTHAIRELPAEVQKIIHTPEASDDGEPKEEHIKRASDIYEISKMVSESMGDAQKLNTFYGDWNFSAADHEAPWLTKASDQQVGHILERARSIHTSMSWRLLACAKHVIPFQVYPAAKKGTSRPS